MDTSEKPKIPPYDLEEPAGNMIQIFPEIGLSKEDIIKKVENTGRIISVEPLDYFINVGNGMNVEAQRAEISKIIPNNVNSPKLRADLALKYLEQDNHIGVDHIQYERDFKKGKDHDATMRFFLQKVLAGERLEPCVVVVTPLANKKYGHGIEKIILDGTHRAVIAAVTNSNLDVLEFALD